MVPIYVDTGTHYMVCKCSLGTHCFRVQLRRVVVDVSNANEGRGSVGQAEVQAALHIGGLNYDGVLRHFLKQHRTCPF